MASELSRSLSGGSRDTHKLLVAAAATLKVRLLTIARTLTTKGDVTPLLAARPAVDGAAAAAAAYQKLLSALSDFVLRLPGDTARHLVDINLAAATEQLLAAITPDLLVPPAAAAAPSSVTDAAPLESLAALSVSEAETATPAEPGIEQGTQQQGQEPQAQQQQQQQAAWDALQALLISVFECLRQQADAAILTVKRTPEALPVLEQLAGPQLMAAAAQHCRLMWQAYTAALPPASPAEAAAPANAIPAAVSASTTPGEGPAAAATSAASSAGGWSAPLSQGFVAPVVSFTCLYGYLLSATESLLAAEPMRQQLLGALASTDFLAASCQLLLGADADAARAKVNAYQLSAWQLLALACALAGGNVTKAAANGAGAEGGTPRATDAASVGSPHADLGPRISSGGGSNWGTDGGSTAGASSTPGSPAGTWQQQQQGWQVPLSLAASQALAAPEVMAFLQERFCHALRELRAGCVPLPHVRLLPGRAAPDGQDVLMALWRVLCCWRALLRCPNAGPFAAFHPQHASQHAAAVAFATSGPSAAPEESDCCHTSPSEAGVVSAPSAAMLLAAALDSALAESVSSGSAREALRAEAAFAAVDCLQELCLTLDAAAVRQNLGPLARALCGVLSATAAHWEASKAAVKCADLPFSAQVKMAGRGTGDLLRRWSRAAGACVSTLHLLLDVAGGRGAGGGSGGGGGGAVSLLSLAGLRVRGEGQAELSSAAAVMVEGGLLAALEQLFRQTPPASTAHAAAAELLACVAPLTAPHSTAIPATQAPTPAPSADVEALLSPFVTLRKFLHRCCGLPEPDREHGVQVAAALCDLVGRLAAEEACDGAYAAFVVAQLLPGLQAFCTSLLKTPGAALVPDAHGGMQHFFSKLLHMLSQLAAADAGKGPGRQQRFLSLLLAHQSAQVVQGILASAYYALPQLAPVPVLSGSLTGDYAAAVVIGLLEDLCASLDASEPCRPEPCSTASDKDTHQHEQLLLATALVRSGLLPELQRTLQLLLQPAVAPDVALGSGLPGLRIGSGSLSRSASGHYPLALMGSRGSSPRASSPRISGYAGGAGLGASLGDLRGIGQLAALIKGDGAAGAGVSGGRSIARSGSGVSLAAAASAHGSRFSGAGNGVTGMSAPSAGLMGSSYGSSAGGLIASGLLGSGNFAGALSNVGHLSGGGALSSGGHGSGALFGSNASLASLAGNQTYEELLNQPSGAAVRCLQARLDAVVLAVAHAAIRQLSAATAAAAASAGGTAGAPGTDAGAVKAQGMALPTGAAIALSPLDGEVLSTLQGAVAAARAGQAAAAAALQREGSTSPGSESVSGSHLYDKSGGVGGASVLLPAALLKKLLSAVAATGQLLGRCAAASEALHSADVLMARMPLRAGCWNVKCMQMGGPSEAKLVLKPCAGCGVAAFCGKRECGKAAGGSHARACTLIAAMRAGQ